MEDKFKVDEIKSTKDQLNLAGKLSISSNILVPDVDTLNAKVIQFNQGVQMKLNGVSTVPEKEKSLTKRRTC